MARGGASASRAANSFAPLADEAAQQQQIAANNNGTSTAANSSTASGASAVRLMDRAKEKVDELLLTLHRRANPVPGAPKFKPMNKGDVVSFSKEVELLAEMIEAARTKAKAQEEERPAAGLDALRKDIAEIKVAMVARASPPAPSSARPTGQPPDPPQPSPKELQAAKRNAEPRVVLKTQHLPNEHPARTAAPAELLKMIAPELKEHTSVQAMSVGRLHSGDLKVALGSKEDERKVLDDMDDTWIQKSFVSPDGDPQPELRRPLYPEHRSLVVHGAPFWLEDDGLAADINRVNQVQVVAARFFRNQRQRDELKKRSNRNFGSAVVAFGTTEERDRFLTSGRLSCGNTRCIVEPYLPAERLQQCDNCQQLGHVGRYCRRKATCRVCGRSHPTKDHPCQECLTASTAGKKATCDRNPQCSLCGGEHAANDDRCPKRLAWREARKLVSNSRATPQQ